MCSDFRTLADFRHLWISLLKQIEFSTPLPCPIGTDITQLETEELQRLARHICRLETNWRKDQPSTVGTIKYIPRATFSEDSLDGRLRLLATIPGTSLVVLLGDLDCCIICCDTDSMEIAKININPNAPSYTPEPCVSAHYDEPGSHFIAFVHHRVDQYVLNIHDKTLHKTNVFLHDRQWLSVISITYETGKPIATQMEYSQAFDVECVALFLCKNVVGCVHADEGNAFLHIIDFVAGTSSDMVVSTYAASGIVSPICASVYIPLNYVQHNAFSLRWSVVGITPFLIVIGETFEVFRCPLEVLPYESDKDKQGNDAAIHVDLERIVKVLPEERYPIRRVYGDDYVNWSPQGLHALVYGFDEACSQYHTTQAAFWPTDALNSPYCKGDVLGSVEIEGDCLSYSWSPSGTYAAIVQELGFSNYDNLNAGPLLHLLHYTHNPPNVRSHRLVLPDIHRSDVSSIAMEERRGRVYLTLLSGHLVVVSYA